MHKEPSNDTEWELKILAEFQLAAALMEQAVWARIDADRTRALDRVSRYSLLKFYLNDSVIRVLRAQGQTSRAEDMWRSQRQKYASLLNEFSKEAIACQARSRETRDAMDSWIRHRHGVKSMLIIRYTVLELRLAFALHGVGLPASSFLARHACARMRRCFPAEIIPIRSTC